MDTEKPQLAGEAILRRLRIFRIVYGVGTTVLIVLAGDFVYPRLDLAIGRVGSDIVEAVVVALVLFILTAPATRELTRSILALDSVRQQLYAESIRDPLTGVFNRRHFDGRLAEEFGRSRRHQLPLSLIAIDVDHFKRINDEFGHLAGDAVLIGVARVLARHRITDVFARIGGDEFALLLPNLSVSGAQLLAEELRHRIDSKEFVVPAAPDRLRLTISCGVAEFVGTDEFDFELVGRADERLLVAKKTRNCVVA